MLTTNRHRLRLRAMLAPAGIILSAVALEAQAPTGDPIRSWPVDTLLVLFEREAGTNTTGAFASQYIFAALELSALYAPRKDSLLNGLERMALTSRKRAAQTLAARFIASAGKSGRSVPPVPGSLQRLIRIYRADTGSLMRMQIADQLPEMADRRTAAAFLREIAAEPDTAPVSHPHGNFPVGDVRIHALERLAEMGAEGRSVLQAMHRTREARSPQARATLERMARRGFPVRDITPQPR